jgi:hypothetical protein
MIRKMALTAAAASLALAGLVATAGPAAAGKVALGNATTSGVISCSITGKVKFSPALSNINTQPSTTTAKTKSTACTGTPTGGPGPIIKAKGLVTSVGTEPGTCSGLTEEGDTPFSAVITWKSTGATLNSSNVTFQNVGPSGLGFNLPSNGEAGKNTSVVTGSFAGEGAWAHADIDSGPVIDALTQPGGCDPNEKGKAKGIKKLTITGGHIDIG